MQKKNFKRHKSNFSNYSDKIKFQQAETGYKKAADELVQLNAEYEKVFEKIMELEAK